MQRREFVAKAVAGSAIAALGIDRALAQTDSKKEPKKAEAGQPATVAGGIQKHSKLGRTGLWVSDIGLGTGGLKHPLVAIRCIELGVNYFDTAPDYGEAEENLGKAIATTKVDRSKLVITSKMCDHEPYPAHLGRSPDRPMTVDTITRCCEASLKRMQTDYIDVYMVHALAEHENDNRLDSEELPKAIDKLKKQGKIRFAGASSHGSNDTLRIIMQALNGGMIDVFMPVCNYMKKLSGTSAEEFDSILATAKKNNVGVVAMKTVPKEQESQQLTELRQKVGEGVPYSQLCFSWALAQDGVATLVKSMGNVKDVDTYVKSSGATLAAREQEMLDMYAAALTKDYCRIGCGDCLDVCPAGVPIPDLLRFNEYFVNYGLERHAMQRYADTAGHAAIAACTTCAAPCEQRCSFDLPVRSLLARADNNLHFDPYVRYA